MSTTFSIRAYNVLFGDAILLTIGTGASARHVLFDFGNITSGKGGANNVFAPVAQDIRSRTGGKGNLAAAVVTHEHLDHMEGFYSQRAIFDEFDVKQVWLSIMSQPGYYTKHPKAERQQVAIRALGGLAARWAAAERLDALPEKYRRIIANNDTLSLTNKQRIDYLRGLSGKAPRYLSRRPSPLTAHGLGAGVKVEILAPEKDASVYYGGAGGAHLDAVAARLGAPGGRRPRRRVGAVPPNMARDEFEQLKDDVAALDAADVFAIDKAANNTSLVVRMTIGGKVLMFCGDAEVESWRVMKEKGVLKPVDVLKIAHHGSVNGMPFDGKDSVIDKVLKPGKKTIAIVSTCRGAYPAASKKTEIPSPDLMTVLRQRCRRVVDTERDADPGEWVEVSV